MTSHNVRMSLGLRSGSVGLVVACALLLAGCSGVAPADPGTAPPTSTESASPSASPTQATEKNRSASIPTPEMPAEAKVKTKEGLESFTRYYVELLEYAYMTGDVAVLDEVNADGCSSCSGPVGDIKNAYSNGGWVVGGQVKATAVSTSFLPSSSGSYFVNLSIRQGAIAYYSGPDDLRKQIPALVDDSPMQLTGSYVGDAWQVDDFSPPKGL